MTTLNELKAIKRATDTKITESIKQFRSFINENEPKNADVSRFLNSLLTDMLDPVEAMYYINTFYAKGINELTVGDTITEEQLDILENYWYNTFTIGANELRTVRLDVEVDDKFTITELEFINF